MRVITKQERIGRKAAVCKRQRFADLLATGVEDSHTSGDYEIVREPVDACARNRPGMHVNQFWQRDGCLAHVRDAQ